MLIKIAKHWVRVHQNATSRKTVHFQRGRDNEPCFLCLSYQIKRKPTFVSSSSSSFSKKLVGRNGNSILLCLVHPFLDSSVDSSFCFDSMMSLFVFSNILRMCIHLVLISLRLHRSIKVGTTMMTALGTDARIKSIQSPIIQT